MKKTAYFSTFEICLWLLSEAVILAAFFMCGAKSYTTLAASLLGATSLVLNAKGNVIGQAMIVAFGIFYGIISYSSAYYGEMITYLGMTAPIATASVVSWARNPSKSGRREVKVNRLERREYIFLGVLSVIVTIAFYFILRAFDTAVLWLSTISVFTSFIAAYLTMRRSEYFAICYAANDIVLIGLWLIAAGRNREFYSLVICFLIFLVNDIYGFVSWQRMKKRQTAEEAA